MNILPEPLKGLAAIKQFIACKLLPSKTRAGKTDKLPYDLSTRSLFNAHDSSYWMSFDAANTLVNLHGAEYCVGFVFTDEDPYWFIDIDNCLQPDAQWNPIAQSLCTVFKGAAIEISSSGKGLHIFGQGTPPAHSCKNSDFNLEFYHTGRFVALTGLNMIGDINFDGSHLLPWLVDNYFPATAAAVPAQWTNEAVADWRGPRDDNELIQRALKAQSPVSVFSGKASFFDLWTRNEIVLTNSYPDTSGDRVYDESSADAALAQHLAFWTGNNCDRMQRIMLQSALVREKWEREDYLPRTILNACARQTQWFCERPMETINPVLSTGSPQHLAPIVREVVGEVCLGAAKQIELFKGCVYVLDEHKILIPGGDLLKPDQFRAHFGGYSFLLDQANQRSPSRNAWEAFTESQILRMPRAVSTCFRPDLPPAEIVYRDGSSFANLWWPCDTLRVEGDASLFTEHVEKLIPNENDRAILTAYMAAVVQHQGVKFRWAPVLQGTPGNGKSLLNRCLAYAVGHKYCHSPDPA